MKPAASTRALTIRRMGMQDLEAVHALEKRSFPTPWPLESFRFELEENSVGRAWVVELAEGESEGRVVAMIVVWLLVDEAHIATLAVDSAHRREGVAKRLLCHALRTCIREGMHWATLEVREGNQAALALYHRFGFEVFGRRKEYYKDSHEDALLMVLKPLDAAKLDAICEND
jgi:ribosomal-protein-alanine N-acetyltransferase